MHEIIGDTFSFPGKLNHCIAADVLDAWYPPHPSVTQFLVDNMNWLVGTSPPCRTEVLRSEVAKHLVLPCQNIILGAGSSDLIFRIMTFLFSNPTKSIKPGPSDQQENRRIGIVSPCYGEYAHVASKLCGFEIFRIFSDSAHFALSARKILEDIRSQSLNAICLVNPSNGCDLNIMYLFRYFVIFC